jgi:hypothetical protein
MKTERREGEGRQERRERVRERREERGGERKIEDGHSLANFRNNTNNAKKSRIISSNLESI